jgi:hypothetical protein
MIVLRPGIHISLIDAAKHCPTNTPKSIPRLKKGAIKIAPEQASCHPHIW